MNKRTRKKYLKAHGLYVNPRETWDLDTRIAQFTLPRLKLYKEKSICYPGRGDMDTPEKWHDAVDKMIAAFELLADEQRDYYWLDERLSQSEKKTINEIQQTTITEGLELFAKYYQNLNW